MKYRKAACPIAGIGSTSLTPLSFRQRSLLMDGSPNAVSSCTAPSQGTFWRNLLDSPLNRFFFLSGENFKEYNCLKSHITLEEVAGDIREPEKFDCKVEF